MKDKEMGSAKKRYDKMAKDRQNYLTRAEDA